MDFCNEKMTFSPQYFLLTYPTIMLYYIIEKKFYGEKIK